MKAIEKDQTYIWHPFDVIDQPQNLFVKKAKGSLIYLQNGTKIIDGISSWWVNLHGHSHPLLNKALRKQLQKLEHILFAGFTHTPAIDLAATLIPALPGNMQKIFFSDNGSTAVEVAIKIAIQFGYNLRKNKKTIIALEGAYHGDTFGAMSVGQRDVFSKPFEGYLFDVQYIPLPTAKNITDVTQKLHALCEKKDVAAFIYEPLVQGSAGMRMYTPDLLNQLLQVALHHDVLLIADEVMTGFGRTGPLFASSLCAIKPDIICLSKGLTGGYLPLGATCVSQNVFAPFDYKNPEMAFLHGHSYTANPLACAVALTSFKLTDSPQCTMQRTFLADTFSNWRKKFESYPRLTNIRQQGTIFAFDYVSEHISKGYFHPVRDLLYHFFIERGVLLRPLGNTVYCIPPYCTTKNQLRHIETTFEELANIGV